MLAGETEWMNDDNVNALFADGNDNKCKVWLGKDQLTRASKIDKSTTCKVGHPSLCRPQINCQMQYVIYLQLLS